MNFINYSFVQQNNGQKTFCALNLENVAQVTPVINDQGYLEFLQILTDLPTTQDYKTYPINGKVDQTGRIQVNKKGEAQINFTNKLVQKHFFIPINDEADIKRILPMFGIDPNQFQYLSEMPEPEQLHKMEIVQEKVGEDPNPHVETPEVKD